MALSQSSLASLWGPRCSGVSARVSLYGAGKVTVRPTAVPAVLALDTCLRHYRYATRYYDTGAYTCRKKVGSSGWSLHSYGIALDINWNSNLFSRRLITDMPSSMVAAIKRIRTNNGKQVWSWGGDWSGNKDSMHYELQCSPRDLATGINASTLPIGTVAPAPITQTPQTPPKLPPVWEKPKRHHPEEDEMLFVQNGPHIYARSGNTVSHIKTLEALKELQNIERFRGASEAEVVVNGISDAALASLYRLPN